MLDAYLPPDSDRRAKRPVFVYMHGGWFSFGDKSNGTKLCTEMAMRGYAAFSVQYRLTGKLDLGKAVTHA